MSTDASCLQQSIKNTRPCTNQDKASPYHDPASDPKNPRWLMVDVQLKQTLQHMVCACV